MLFVLTLLFPALAHAQVNCDTAATPTNPSQLSCGADRVAAYVNKNQKVTGLTLLVSDTDRGFERRVELHKVNLPLAKLNEKNLTNVPAVKAELAKIKKEWNNKNPRVEVLSYEFDAKTTFFNSQDLKGAVPVAKLMRTQPRSVASEAKAQAGGIRTSDK